jgi:predicted  nucleic acid-binding Zn-ribbon protein
MGDGVLIKYTELDELNTKLKDIVAELDGAADRADVLEDAIGDPYGKNRLREAVEDFEDRWNNKRENLAADIKKVQEHVQGVLEGFEQWDLESSAGG